MEDLEQQTMRDVVGTARLHLAYVGISNGLLEALAAGGMTAAALAAATGRDEGYVVRWCDAAFAFELLDERDGCFSLTPRGAAFRPDVEGSLMPFAVQVMIGAHVMERAAGLMRTGERPGDGVLAERETILPWFGPMLEASFGPMFRREVLPSVPAFAEVDARGGVAVDLGCGNGWYLRELAARQPRLRGIGLDGFAANIEQARERAAAAGLGERLSFQVGDLHRFAIDEPVDLIAMNRALHHVWNEKENVFRILREHLAPGGFAVIWEPVWPDDRAELRDPARRGVALQNLAEHVQGNHFLRPQDIAAELGKAGFGATIHLIAGGREAVIVGRKPG